jgi:hypothetical protein
LKNQKIIRESPYKPLPLEAAALCETTSAPPRLVAHLTLVHDVASTLIDRLAISFPELRMDKETILFGAATHDLGKTAFKEELSQPGHLHETAGMRLLMSNGVPEARARFAFTHSNWQSLNPLQLEDLLVALADKCWKGKRDNELEAAIVTLIAKELNVEAWVCYSALDEILQEIASKADARLAWQMNFPV